MQFQNPYPFLNPMYGNYGQVPNAPQMTQPIGVSGKYVNDFGEISIGDIPMNGPAIFAKNDRSEIQIREWSPNGQIVTTSYKAVVEDVPAPVEQPTLDLESAIQPVLDKLTELEQQVAKLSKPVTKVVKKDGE